MEFEVLPLDNNTSRILLKGRMDSSGVDKSELRFTAAVVAPARHAVIDISGVDFLASMGIRLFITSARALSQKGAKMALYGASEAVQSVLDTVALDQVIPVKATQTEALEAIQA